MNLSKAQREELKLKYGGRCAYCGSVLGDKWHADHLEPLGREGEWRRKKGERWGFDYVMTGKVKNPTANRLENMMPACVPCNVNKSNIPLEQWRLILEGLPSAIARDHASFRHAARFGLVCLGRAQVKFHFETYLVRHTFTLK